MPKLKKSTLAFLALGSLFSLGITTISCKNPRINSTNENDKANNDRINNATNNGSINDKIWEYHNNNNDDQNKPNIKPSDKNDLKPNKPVETNDQKNNDKIDLVPLTPVIQPIFPIPSNDELDNFYPKQIEEEYNPKDLSEDEIISRIKNQMETWNYFAHPKYVLEKNNVTVYGDGQDSVKLKLLEKETGREVSGVRWFQKTRIPYTDVFAAEKEGDKSYLTLTSSGVVSRKKPHEENQIITEVWAEYKGYLYQCLVKVASNDETRNIKEELIAEQEAEKIISDWKNLPTLQKVIKAHEWMVTNVIYLLQATPQDDETAYAALVNKRAICNGYAKAFRILMKKLGVPVSIITGGGNQALFPGYVTRHVWNLVEIDGEWYHVDTTWDRARTGNKSNNQANYNFFLMHDDDFGKENSFYNVLSDNMGQRYRNLKLNNFVKSADEAMALFDVKYSDENNIPRWFEFYAEEKKLNEIEKAFTNRGINILDRSIKNVSWMNYKKIRYQFANNFKFQKINDIKFNVHKHSVPKEILGEYTIKVSFVEDINNINLLPENFKVKNAMIKKIEKSGKDYILYLDNFEKYGNVDVGLEIKKQGYKFIFNNQHKVSFDVKKHQTPKVKVYANGPKSIVLSGVSEKMEYRNNFGKWKNIPHDNYQINDVILGSISIRVKDNFDKFKSDIQVISLPKASDINNKVKAFDGMIIGVDNTMEFRVKGSEKWIPIKTTKLKNLKSNTYQFRVKGNNNTLASEIHEVNLY
ncbi:MAG6410 family transglutaminase-related lipoprotein [Metamycoplasma alkalescens]|uniref:Transglutaminase superfamily protein n=5 Tax=Metamycoplasma alkalescens TaxID=45363 RepID=A0A318U887_9BACT|nr:transglutaminase domain-containing protein [Metamycoplasma alkalescens]PYF43624.1 transglutaminase superfamily protein [Metamycoplasma alkalescens]